MSAWTFVAAGGNGSAQSGTITLTLPAGHATGDTLLCLCAAKVHATTVPVPAGYTSVYNKSTWLQLLAKIDGGSETNPTIATGGANMQASLVAFRGGPGTLPTVTTSATTNNLLTNAGTLNTPALTPTVDNGLVIALAEGGDNYTGFTSNPSGFASLDHFAFATGSCSLMWAYVIQTARANIAADGFAITGFGANVGCDGSVIVLDSGVLLASAPKRSLLGVGT